jgi:hypothetical protein
VTSSHDRESDAPDIDGGNDQRDVQRPADRLEAALKGMEESGYSEIAGNTLLMIRHRRMQHQIHLVPAIQIDVFAIAADILEHDETALA